MKNVRLQVIGQELIIKVDLTQSFGPSSSGTTTIISSTEGNVSLQEADNSEASIIYKDVKVGLNVYKK
jgi:hypothetical protein